MVIINHIMIIIIKNIILMLITIMFMKDILEML